MFAGLLSIPEALLLGIIEGITEFLPISSTGHLLVVGHLIGFGKGEASVAADTYSIAIQFGAILAVMYLYRVRMWSMARGVFGADNEGRAVLTRLILAFLPAAFLGAVFGDALKEKLFGPVPVAIAWCVGGVVLLVWKQKPGTTALTNLSLRNALIIGLAQGLALWPGVSRSLVTLIAALALGLSMSAALEFSFLLGLLTLSAATFFDLSKHGSELVDQFGLLAPSVGFVCAFITALVAVKWMVAYLADHSLRMFGWYRLGAGAVTGILLLTNVL
jgi:undecaprenyl-diphosphatase